MNIDNLAAPPLDLLRNKQPSLAFTIVLAFHSHCNCFVDYILPLELDSLPVAGSGLYGGYMLTRMICMGT